MLNTATGDGGDATIRNRRALHQPFFPLLSNPSPPDTTTTTTPFTPAPTTATTTAAAPLPFFPATPSPPPPPSIPTFPANLTSLPARPLPPSAATPRRLVPLIVLPASLALAAFLLAVISLLILRRRRHRRSADTPRLYPPDTPASDKDPGPSSSASEFLYLGTLVRPPAPDTTATSTSPYHKLGSPELRPLPPLPPLARRSSDEEFYSPSLANKSSPVSALRKCASQGSTLSSPSYLSSPSPSSSPPISSSPGQSTVRSPSSRGTVFIPPPPPAPPRLNQSVPPTRPPPPPLQPPVFVPPKWKVMKDLDVAEKEGGKARPKLKPLHWDKVHPSSDGSMVWDHLRSNSFELNEEMIAALFGCEATNLASEKATRRKFSSSPNQENGILDPKKSQNIAILLRALNVTKEEVCQALLEGNTDSLSFELLETLLKMAPSKQEEFKLKEYEDGSPFKLGPAEKFLKAVLDIPFAFKRVDAMLYIANFESEFSYLWNSFETLEAACEELRSSRLFLKLLEAVLKTGNRMNVGTNRGDAEAFKLDTLLKLVDVKGTDGKTTLLHFVVHEITKAEGLRASVANLSTTETNSGVLRDDLQCKMHGLQVVSGLGSELSNVKNAATMDSDVLSSSITRLAHGIGKITEVLRLNSGLSLKEKSQLFHDSMSAFLTKAEDKILKLRAQEELSMALVNELTMYFHGGSAKEEAHPLRIFMVVRDFLGILDKVCREVRSINEQAIVSPTHHVPVPANPTQNSVFPRHHTSSSECSDDESSSYSSS